MCECINYEYHMEANARKLEIKKYPNRRYYDATHSRHLTLDEIRSLIQEGCDITVTDAKTGDDITAQVLTQIILELETAKLDSFPVPLLLRLIRMNDQLVKDFIESYFNQALKSFLDYQRAIEAQVRQAQPLPSGFPSISAWTEAMLKPFATSFAGRPGESNPQPPRSSPDTGNSELRELVRDLQQQVSELKRGRKTTKTRVRRSRKKSE